MRRFASTPTDYTLSQRWTTTENGQVKWMAGLVDVHT